MNHNATHDHVWCLLAAIFIHCNQEKKYIALPGSAGLAVIHLYLIGVVRGCTHDKSVCTIFLVSLSLPYWCIERRCTLLSIEVLQVQLYHGNSMVMAAILEGNSPWAYSCRHHGFLLKR